jgi:hypothetical protein
LSIPSGTQVLPRIPSMKDTLICFCDSPNLWLNYQCVWIWRHSHIWIPQVRNRNRNVKIGRYTSVGKHFPLFSSKHGLKLYLKSWRNFFKCD